MVLRILVAIAAAIALATPAPASEPGQPLDCSDWVFLEPGLSCSVVRPANCATEFACLDGNPRAIDNQERLLWITSEAVGNVDCPGLGLNTHYRLKLIALENTGERVLGYVDDRCGSVGGVDAIRHIVNTGSSIPDRNWGKLEFDASGGRVLIPIVSQCITGGRCPGYSPLEPPPPLYWLAAIEGFATTFDILQTYSPIQGPLSFTVPYMPEGLPAANYFDTYYGDLATVGDWSQARPLQCGYPATPPSVGDYFTVEDALPAPAPGTGRYYVTAVTHQGQRRLGRQRIDGVLSGRDSAGLPECE